MRSYETENATQTQDTKDRTMSHQAIKERPNTILKADRGISNTQPYCEWDVEDADGRICANIEAEYQDVGGNLSSRSSDWRIFAYVVTSFTDETKDEEFFAAEYKGARQALTAAKKYARNL